MLNESIEDWYDRDGRLPEPNKVEKKTNKMPSISFRKANLFVRKYSRLKESSWPFKSAV